MQSTTNRKGLTGISADKGSKSVTKRKLRKRVSKVARTHNPVRPQRQRLLHTFDSAGILDTSDLSFKSKLGYHVLKERGLINQFSLHEKIRALMIYNCIRHLPEFVEKKFDDVNEATAYVYMAAKELLDNDFGFVGDLPYSAYEDIPQNYAMQIVYETFGEQFSWQSYKPLLDIPCGRLQKAVAMCIHIVVMEFGFTLVDAGEYDMDFDSWVQYELEGHQEDIDYAYNKYEEEKGKSYDPKTDEGIDDERIQEALERMSLLEECIGEHTQSADPLMESIRTLKVSASFIKSVIKEYKNEPVANWMSFILELRNKKFRIHQYVAESYKESGEDYADESSVSPISGYGYTYDDCDQFAESMERMFTENGNNYCILPLSINMVIQPDTGKVYKTPDVPLGAWLKRIFSFNFKTMDYEAYGRL